MSKTKSGLGENPLDKLIKKTDTSEAGTTKKITTTVYLSEPVINDLEQTWRDIRILSDKQKALRRVSKSIIMEVAIKNIIKQIKQNKDNVQKTCEILEV